MHLIQQHEVEVLVLCTSRQEARDVEDLRRAGIAVTAIYENSAICFLRMFRALFTPFPFQVAFVASSAWRAAVEQALASGRFDIVHVESLRALAALPETTTLPLVWDAVDCISQLYQLGASHRSTLWMRFVAPHEAQRVQCFEKAQLARFDHVLVTSERERQALQARSATETLISVLAHGIDRSYYQPDGQSRWPETLIFTGKMSFHGNVAGAIYLVRQIMPLIWQQCPGVRLIIAGANPPNVVRCLARDPRIEVTGTVSDLRLYIARAQVAVSPLPYAVGIQNKVLEAMALNTPVVTTSCVAAGLATTDGVVVADEPEDFAEAVLDLLRNPSYHHELVLQGRRYISTYHDWKQVIQKLNVIYQCAC